MKPAAIVLAIAATVATLIGGAALAHHSYGMFDRSKEQEISATVREFQWTNPHARAHVTLEGDAKGAGWDIEMGPPGQLARSGWKRNSLKPGDKVKILIFPMRDGSPGGHLLRVTTPAGEDLYDIVFKKPPAKDAKTQ